MILTAAIAPRNHGRARYHQRVSGLEMGVDRIIKLAIGITVSAIQRKTSADLKKPISYDLTSLSVLTRKYGAPPMRSLIKPETACWGQAIPSA